MQRNTKIGVAIVAIALITSATILIAIPFLLPLPPISGSATVRVIEDETEVELTLQDLALITPQQGFSSLQNRFGNWRDAGTYVGPKLSAVIETVTTIDENDVIRVNASDGWTVYYAYYNLYPNSTIHEKQGDLILAYSLNGTTPPTWLDGLRTVFLPEDEAYSNDDANQTTHPAWFFGSAGARWNKNVVIIEILRDMYFEKSKSISIIDGENEHTLYLQDLVFMNSIAGFSSLQNKHGHWRDAGTYRGPLLSTIIEVFDSIDENDLIRVNASDGYSVSYAHYNLYPNASVYALQGDLILAYSYNETMTPTWADGLRTVFLPEDGRYSNDDANLTTYPDWFFRSAGARWNKNVVTIEILRDSFPPLT